jgi:hypothetical protein
MDLKVLGIEATEPSNHIPAVKDAIHIIALALTRNFTKPKPHPAIKRINLSETNVHGLWETTASSLSRRRSATVMINHADHSTAINRSI